MSEDKQGGEQRWEQLQEKVKALREATGEVIVGQDKVVELMLVSLFCKGHCLLVGVPGLAKTLLVSTLGKTLGLNFQRIQFTPDLMPTDIVGSEILQTKQDGSREFEFAAGPIFTNLLLADEINRTPPKTQAALLEAMQEKQVTVAGETRNLEEPFVVFATQNPIEHEGTYPLPEAQLDRFFFSLRIDYPSIEDEEEILMRTTGLRMPEAKAVLDVEGLVSIQNAVHEVPMPKDVVKAILKLVHSSRPDSELATEGAKQYLSFGAGPRASQCFVRSVKALALLRGKSAASIEELRDLAAPVLRHRLIPNYNATGEGVGVEEIVAGLVKNL